MLSLYDLCGRWQKTKSCVSKANVVEVNSNGKWWFLDEPNNLCEITQKNNTLETNGWYIVQQETTKNRIVWSLPENEGRVIWTKLISFNVRGQISINDIQGKWIKDASSVTNKQQTLVNKFNWWFVNDTTTKYKFNLYKGTLETNGWILSQQRSLKNKLLWIGLDGEELTWNRQQNNNHNINSSIITEKEVRNLLNKHCKITDNTDCKLNFGDGVFSCIPKECYLQIWKSHIKCNPSYMQYIKEKRVCNQFALQYHSTARECYPQLKYALPVGEVWAQKHDKKSSHAYNVIITYNQEVLFFEPQTGEFHKNQYTKYPFIWMIKFG